LENGEKLNSLYRELMREGVPAYEYNKIGWGHKNLISSPVGVVGAVLPARNFTNRSPMMGITK